MTESPPFPLIVDETAQRFPNRTAIEFEGQKWTFHQIAERIADTARRLTCAGVRSSDRVAILLDNRPEYMICQFALARIGAAFATPNPSWTQYETQQALATTEVKWAIVDDIRRRHPDHAVTTIPIDSVVPPSPPPLPIDRSVPQPPDPSSELFIPFSSGTTGFPKGVVHTGNSVSGAIDQLIAHISLSADDRLQVSLPLCHIFGTTMLSAAMKVGARVTLFRRFDFHDCVRHIRTGGITVWPLAGAVAHRLAREPNLSPSAFPDLRFFMWGGSAVPAALAHTISSVTGVGFLCSYGMTEAMMVAFNPVDDPREWRLDSPGFPTIGTELRLAHDGELEVRGPSVASGYAGPADSSSFTIDGWFRTGDVATIDDEGRLHIVDRKKDMIKVSGFQVAPAEVESELSSHPLVSDVAVIGEPDDRTGERVVAFVVVHQSFEVAELTELASKRLASYKIPSRVYVVDTLPRTSAGKLQRGRLRSR